MKFIIFSVLPFLMVSASAEAIDSKKAESTESHGQNQIAYIPVDKLDIFNNHPYPFFNMVPIAKSPQQQHYYPNSYPQQSNFFVPRSAEKFFAPQYDNNQWVRPQAEQLLSKPAAFLSIPFDIGMRGLGFMSKVLDNVHQGVNFFTGYVPENKGWNETGNEYANKNWVVDQGIKSFTGFLPQNNGWVYPRYENGNSVPAGNELTNKNFLVDQGIKFFTGFIPQNKGFLYPRYETRNNAPVGNDYTNKKWPVEYNYPTYNHGENERYSPNLEKGHQSLYPPGKSSVYEYANGNGYPRWLVPNNQHVNY